MTVVVRRRLPINHPKLKVSLGDFSSLPSLQDDLAADDIFLTLGVDGNADQTVLSYEHFPARHWYQNFDLSKAGDEKAQTQARYKLADNYRRALLEEPMRLVEFVVRLGQQGQI